MSKEAILIEECREYKKSAQKKLYEMYAPAMRSVCRRYAANFDEAEDILQEGFLKVFSKIRQYKAEGAFCSWVKRIFVNTAISHYRKKSNRFNFVNIEPFGSNFSERESEYEEEELSYADLSVEEITAAINLLPESLSVVVNLYLIEDYSHRDISEVLGISVENSKIRLLRGKHQLQKILLEVAASKKKHHILGKVINWS
jgi:RNA polymerase sigma-70 factor, ECF subfamily